GTGYFYIPGTETCLKIGGFIRFQTSFGPNEVNSRQGWGDAGTSDWDSFSRAYISFDAKSDTEFGTLTGFFAAEFNADNDTDAGDSRIDVDEAYIQLGGLKAGFFYSWWDKGLNGESDTLGNNTEFNSIAYLYDGGSFQAGIAIDELEGATTKPNGVGVEAIVSATVGGVSFDLLGGYDTEVEEGAIRALLSADLGPGTFQLAGIWASDPNAYWNASEWTVAASYAFKATDKLKITPGAQYWGDYKFNSDLDRWRAGLTLDYAITEGLATRVSVQYNKEDINATTDRDFVSGFVRLQRNF
ncbi:porin, partial [Ensifer sp. Root954]